MKSYRQKRPLCCNPKKVCYDEVNEISSIDMGQLWSNTKITKVTPLEKISLALEIPRIGPQPKVRYAERQKTG